MARRQDVAQALASEGASTERLAGRLLNSEGQAKAVGGLNLFLRQVLELACFRGGSLDLTTAAREGMGREEFKNARKELVLWGLAVPSSEQEIQLLPGLNRLIWDPGHLGTPAEFMLEPLTVEVLRPMGQNMGVAPAALHGRKGPLIGALVARMADSRAVVSLLEHAPALAKESFNRIRAGLEPWDLGWRSGRMELDTWRWHPDRAADGPWWLVGHGLALPKEQWGRELVIPAEVELSLRGRLFPRWEPQPPPVKLGPLPDGRHPLELVAALSALLEDLRVAPAPALQQGGLPKRVLKRLAVTLRQDEVMVEWLARVALGAGLLEEVELVPEQRSRSRRNPLVIQQRKAEIRVAAAALAWSQLSEPERFIDFGRRVLFGGADSWEHQQGNTLVGRTLTFLRGLPEGAGAQPADLARALHWAHPALFPSEAGALGHLQELGTALRWLGAGTDQPVVGLSAAGRLLGSPSELDQQEVAKAFPAALDHFTVTADHRVVVSGPPTSTLSRFLSQVADVESVQPARVYRVGEGSLRRGLDGGLTGAEIEEFFDEHAKGGLPQNVRALIADVARRHGRVRVGWGPVYVVSDDPAELDLLVKGRALRPLAVRRVANNVAVVEAKSQEQVLSLLRKGGLLPVPDKDEERGKDEGSARVRDAGAGGARLSERALRRAATEPKRPSPTQLASALLATDDPGSGPGDEAGDATSPGAIANAFASRRPICLGYRSLTGQSVRVLWGSPIADVGGVLRLYEYSLRQALTLDRERVVWATRSEGAIRVRELEGASDASARDVFDDDWEFDSER